MESPFEGLPKGHFGVIACDPPWRFRTYSALGRDRCPEKRHYQTMTLDDIKAMPVAELAAPSCALFMWAIDPMIPEALELGKAWGFEFKTVAFYWVKLCKTHSEIPPYQDQFPISTGYWTRGNPEQCLLFTRGKPRRISAAVRKLIIAPRREHSRKPDDWLPRIERLVPGPYIELFARQTRPGWAAFGNETDKFTAAVAA